MKAENDVGNTSWTGLKSEPVKNPASMWKKTDSKSTYSNLYGYGFLSFGRIFLLDCFKIDPSFVVENFCIIFGKRALGWVFWEQHASCQSTASSRLSVSTQIWNLFNLLSSSNLPVVFSSCSVWKGESNTQHRVTFVRTQDGEFEPWGKFFKFRSRILGFVPQKIAC